MLEFPKNKKNKNRRKNEEKIRTFFSLLPLPVGQPDLPLRREAVLPAGGRSPQRVHHPQVARRDRFHFREINPVALDRGRAGELDQTGTVLVVGGLEVARGEEVAELGPVDSGLKKWGCGVRGIWRRSVERARGGEKEVRREKVERKERRKEIR